MKTSSTENPPNQSAPNLTPPEKSRNKIFTFVIITLIIDLMGIGLIWPILPKLIEQLTGADIANASSYYGWLLTAYALMQFIFSPLIGILSDRFGRRPILLTSLLALAVDYLLMSIAPNYIFLLLARILSGIFGATYSTGYACIADITEPKKRAGAFGMMGAAFGVGFTIGPAIGGFLGSIDLHYPFYFAAALAFGNFLFGFFNFPETHKQENRNPVDLKMANPFAALLHIRKFPSLIYLIFSLFFVALAQHGLESIWVLWSDAQLGWGISQVGYSLAFVGLCSMFSQGYLLGKIVPIMGEQKIILWGYIISGIFTLCLAFVSSSWLTYVLIFCIIIGNISNPALQAIASQTVSEKEQGLLQGTLNSVQSLTLIFAPLIATNIFAASVQEGALTPYIGSSWPGFYFIIGFGFYMIGVILLLRGRSR